MQNKTYAFDKQLQEDFIRVKAKLFAYLNPVAKTLSAYPEKDTSVAAQYARAIAYFKKLDFAKAHALLDRLIALEPNNPYFYELKGQIYLETAKIRPAVKEYQKALSLMPNSALLQISLAQALLEASPLDAEIKQAITLLNKANISRPMSFSWLLLSRAYGMNGNEAEAAYASAEYSYALGAYEVAKTQAQQAQKLAKNSKLKLRISDLLDRLANQDKKRS